MAAIRERKAIFGLRSTEKKITSPLPPATLITEFPHTEHIRYVRERLAAFGFGEPVKFLTENGLDRSSYITFARKKLLGQEYADGVPQGKMLPEKVGEVTIPENIRQHAQKIAFIDFFMNLGYGHLRPAAALQNVIELLGGNVKNVFFGGPENVLPEKGLITDAFFQQSRYQYTTTCLNIAHQQGMISEVPYVENPNPKYGKTFRRILLAAKPLKTLNTILHRGNLDSVIREMLTIQDTDTPLTMKGQALFMRALFGKTMEGFIRKYEQEHPGKDLYVFSTHALLARLIGHLPRRVQKDIVTGHFEPDVAIVLAGYTKEPRSYIEKAITAKKWGHRMGRRDGSHASNTFVLDGYITPLSIFARDELTKARQEAAIHDQPLTVIGIASGVAPTQLEPFTKFLQDGAEEMRNGKLRMVIQCGAEEGGGKFVYDTLQQVVTKNNLSEHVVLHLAKTPQAAVDFFEAASWAPVPLAMYVKGAEVSRMAHALNIPLIPTGTIGDHEIWNIAATVLEHPQHVVFPQVIGNHFTESAKRHVSKDVLATYHPEYTSQLLTGIAGQMVKDTETLITYIRAYITSGQESPANAHAMLSLLSDMISRKHPQKKS